MLEELGELLGWGIGILYGLTILSYILKFINKKFGKEINKNKNIKKYYIWISKYIIKYHKIFGLLTIIAISSHFILQYNSIGISISGVTAALVMISQVILGIFIKKNDKGYKVKIHRSIAILLAITIAIHLLLG